MVWSFDGNWKRYLSNTWRLLWPEILLIKILDLERNHYKDKPVSIDEIYKLLFQHYLPYTNRGNWLFHCDEDWCRRYYFTLSMDVESSSDMLISYQMYNPKYKAEREEWFLDNITYSNLELSCKHSETISIILTQY